MRTTWKLLFSWLLANQQGSAESAGGEGSAGAASQNILEGAQAPAGTGSPAPATGTEIRWPEGLDETLRGESMFKPFIQKDTGDIHYGNLMKSYYHAQKAVGRDKVAVLREDSTPEEVNEFYQKALGVDPHPANYKPEFNKEKVNLFNEPLLEKFRQKAHELKLPPKAAAQMAEFFNEQMSESVNTINQRNQQQIQEGFKGLEQEWGEAYNQRVTAAKRFIQDYADDNFKKHLAESGLASDPGIFRFFGELATKFYGEGKVPKDSAGTGDIYTPSEASSRINEIMADRKHAYHNSKDPRYQDAIKEVKRLFQMKNA